MRDLHQQAPEVSEIKFQQIYSLEPFYAGLEFSAPCRGMWTVAHTPMLVPESHQIYVCASGCLQGVVLSVAEYEGLDRYSMVLLEERDIIQGQLEPLFIDGVTDILNKLPKIPKVVLSFTSCIHHFVGTDVDYIYRQLRKRFPNVVFIPCQMDPTMRKSGLPAEERLKQQIYSVWDNVPKDRHGVNVIGNNFPYQHSGDHIQYLESRGYHFHDICDCTSYEQFKSMERNAYNIYHLNSARSTAHKLEQLTGQQSIYLPHSYSYAEIKSNLSSLAQLIGDCAPDVQLMEQRAQDAIDHALQVLGDTPIVIDYTATSRPLGLAWYLLDQGFNVIKIYADTIAPDEEGTLHDLKDHYPDLLLHATVHYDCRLDTRSLANEYSGYLLAIGQKAAYYSGTQYFVNLIENSGYYGFDGITRLANLMVEAMLAPAPVREISAVKGWGCMA